MTITVATALRNARLNLIRDALDAGSGNGWLDVYEGSMPAGADDPPNGTHLASIPLQDPSAADASGAELTFDGPIEGTVGVTGTAGYVRLRDSDNNHVIYLEISTTPGQPNTAYIEDPALESGDYVEVDPFTLQE